MTLMFRQCSHCKEPIADREPFELTNNGTLWFHRECMIRMVIGSVGHQQKKCSCFGGTQEDPPGMSCREAAIAAANLFLASKGE